MRTHFIDRVLLIQRQQVWRECCVLKDWAEALKIPIPKKGELGDNLRGISCCMDVVGKV